MTVITNLTGADQYVLQEALSAYTDEAYTNAKKLVGTGIVGDNPMITTDTETFIGQLRWFKPMNPTINNLSLTDSTDGTPSTFDTDYLTYIKAARSYGAEKVNMQQIVTQQDGLAKQGRDFAEHRAQDEHNALLAVLKGVAMAEALNGAAAGSGATGLGGQTFTNDPTDMKYGFYVDLGSAAPVVAASTTQQGAQRAEGFLNAFGMAYKDYEPDYAYLVTSPQMIAAFRSANLVDQDKVTDGEVEFETIFSGKFRLIKTRATQSFSSAELTRINTGAGVDIVGTKTSFIVLPGAIAFKGLEVPDPVEIYRDARKYKGGGVTSIWHRWGFVTHPTGYTWNGGTSSFPTDAEYGYVVESGTPKAVGSATSGLASTTGTWVRKTNSALSLGILPVFHS
jgi:hypothetical protein